MSIAVRTGLEPATPCVTGMYSNQAELPHQSFLLLCGSLAAALTYFVIASAKLVVSFELCKYFRNIFQQLRNIFRRNTALDAKPPCCTAL